MKQGDVVDSARLVAAIWSWLPVFKAVAETEHLPTAAKQLHVSPSALSRTIRLIEEQLEQELFVRGGRRITLNAAGQRLLRALQRSTTTLEQGVRDALGEEALGELRISSLGVLTDYVVLPTLLQLKQQRSDLVPSMTTQLASAANRGLATGALDVAFYYDATTSSGIVCEQLGSLKNSVYCGVGHPLFKARSVSRARLLEHELSVAAIGDRGTPMDGWPVDLQRRIGFRIFLLSTNVHVALSGQLVCVLPDIVAAPLVQERRLRCVDASLIPDTMVYAAWREEDASRPIVVDLVSSVRKKIASAPRVTSTRKR